MHRLDDLLLSEAEPEVLVPLHTLVLESPQPLTDRTQLRDGPVVLEEDDRGVSGFLRDLKPGVQRGKNLLGRCAACGL